MPLVFITGSGRRIGKGLALEFAKKGWDVAVNYYHSSGGAFDTVAKIRELGLNSTAVKADVCSIDELKLAFKEIIAQIGIPDVLVNNAGVFPEAKPIAELGENDWDSSMGINARSQFLSSKIFTQFSKPGAKIVNFASLGGVEIWKNRIPYNVSKAAAIQLTKALARELAPEIAVNCICPGSIKIIEEPSENDKFLIPLNKIPMNRYGNIKDIFEAVYFFSTCSQYITGQVLIVDGGNHLVK